MQNKDTKTMSGDSTPLSSSPLAMSMSSIESQSSLFSSTIESQSSQVTSSIKSQSSFFPSLLAAVENERRSMKRDVYQAAESGSKHQLIWQNNWKHQRTPTGNNVLHIHVGKPIQNQKGVVTENVCIVFIRFVIDETTEDSLLLQTNDRGDTPLHLAARYGQVDAVEEFLKWENIVKDGLLSKANNRNDTALHDAARGGHVSIVQLLVKAGGETALQHLGNDMKETPLFLAAERGFTDSFRVILEHRGLSALEHQGPCSQTPLHAAVLCADKGIVDQIMETDIASSLIRIQNDEGRTPLHSCAALNTKKQNTILSVLLDYDDEYNSAAYIQDNEGRTPLHLATLNLNIKGAKMLIRSYPDCVEIVDNKGENVVHCAANKGCLDIFRWFLKNLPMCSRLVNEKNNDGNTPLHLLAATTATLPSHGCFFRLQKFIKLHKRLDVREVNNNNLTAGDIIASNNSLRHFAAPKQTRKILPRGKRTSSRVAKAESCENVEMKANVQEKKRKLEKQEKLEKVHKEISNKKKSGETRLVVAALIATVSFTAGFTVPGGFDQNPGQNAGMALLARKTAFIAFLISDTTAFTLSSLAVICYFAVASQIYLTSVERMTVIAHLLSTLSMGALMIAFMTGVYALVSNSPDLAFTIIAICTLYFCFYLFLLIVSCGKIMIYLKRHARSRLSE